MRSRDEMVELLQDERYFAAYFETLPIAEAFYSAQEAALKANEDEAGSPVAPRRG